MSFFEHIPLAPADPILGVTLAFNSDMRSQKVNLGVGLFKDETLKTPVLDVVKSAEKELLNEEKSKEYLPIEGDYLYLDRIGQMVFGKHIWGKEKERIASFQAVGGTGALKVGATFLQEEMEPKVLIPYPTWPNHLGVFSHCSLIVKEYPYYNFESHQIEFEKLLSYLQKAVKGSVVLLHAACHNPTGCDFSKEQWHELAALCKQKQLIAFFDFAYQGLGKDIEEDAYAIRYFFQQGLEMLVAISNAKNFSLYAERLGALFIVTSSKKNAIHLSSRVKQVIRTNYSNPPLHGAKIVAKILSDSQLCSQWEEELKKMRERMIGMRILLAKKLKEKARTIDFDHLQKGLGMFAFTGLSQLQVKKIATDYGIYMPADGRINVCGLNAHNIDLVVDAIIAVINA